MARQIIKQPNGLYAEYSTIVDAFVMWDATADDIIQNSRQAAADAAERQCREALENADAGKVRGFGLLWEEVLESHNRHRTPEDRAALLTKLDARTKSAREWGDVLVGKGRSSEAEPYYWMAAGLEEFRNELSAQNDSELPQPAAEGSVGVAYTELFSVDGVYADFRLTVTERSDHSISGDIEEITAWECDDANTPCDSDHYMSFYMKWDGCCHVWFGSKLDEETHDGYLHLCGADSWDKHIALMRWLYKWAAKAIPMDKDAAGDIS